MVDHYFSVVETELSFSSGQATHKHSSEHMQLSFMRINRYYILTSVKLFLELNQVIYWLNPILSFV